MSSQPLLAIPEPSLTSLPWYAIRTKSNQERIAASVLESKGFEQFLPTYRAKRRWSDRVVETTLPLFPGYVFCRFDKSRKSEILSTPGVASVVSFAGAPAPIGDSEISAIQTLIESGSLLEPHPYLKEGQPVRVVRGPLEGAHGILVKKRDHWRMLVSISLLQRSVAVEVDRECLAEI
jgi:transcription antitermination factor NusG